MKNLTYLLFAFFLSLGAIGCTGTTPQPGTATDAAVPSGGGQSAVQDDVSQKDVVKVAAASADHTARWPAWVSLPPKPPPMRRHSTVTALTSSASAWATQCWISPGCWVLL